MLKEQFLVLIVASTIFGVAANATDYTGKGSCSSTCNRDSSGDATTCGASTFGGAIDVAVRTQFKYKWNCSGSCTYSPQQGCSKTYDPSPKMDAKSATGECGRKKRSDGTTVKGDAWLCDPIASGGDSGSSCGMNFLSRTQADDASQCYDGAVQSWASSCGNTTVTCNAGGGGCDVGPGPSIASKSMACGGGGIGFCSQYCGSTCLDSVNCGNPFLTAICVTDVGGTHPTCAGSPIIIDPLGQGFQLTSVADGVNFKPQASGSAVRFSWTRANSANGWLVLDRNGNGTIDDLSEMFGDQTPQPSIARPNGFNALAVFDSAGNGGNENGRIDPGDQVFWRLRLWVDRNHNGISEARELLALPLAGVFGIDLAYDTQPFYDANGNLFQYQSRIYDLSAHSSPLTYDVFLVTDQRPF